MTGLKRLHIEGGDFYVDGVRADVFVKPDGSLSARPAQERRGVPVDQEIDSLSPSRRVVPLGAGIDQG